LSCLYLRATNRLLSLPGLGQLPLPPVLGSLSTSLGVETEVPPPEAAGVVSDELLVVHIVVLGASPERKEVVQAPRELVAAVRINGLEYTDGDPGVHGENVEVLGDGTPEDGAADGSEAQDHDFNGRGVLGGDAEGSRVLVVNLVDVLVQERACVHEAMRPVVPGIFHDEENGDLVGHLEERRERNRCREAEVLAHRVEEPDLGEFDGKVGEEDEERALELLPGGGDFVLCAVSFGRACGGDTTYRLDLVTPEHGQAVDDDPGQCAPKVKGLVNDKGHDACGEDIVAHPRVPGQPHLLKVVERDVVLGDLLEGAPVRVLRHWRQNGGRVPVAHVRKWLGGVGEHCGTYISPLCSTDSRDAERARLAGRVRW
jgi:hypothetical protein